MLWRSPLTVGLIALSSCTLRTSGTPETTVAPTVPAANAVFVRAIDGDTIDVLIDGREERIRLIGIDTPESVDRDQPVECFGREASAFTKSLFSADQPLYLERDLEARDDYGRLLAYVYRLPDGLFVNLEIIRRGYAQPFTFPTNSTHAPEFVEAARDAEAADLGLWAACRDT